MGVSSSWAYRIITLVGQQEQIEFNSTNEYLTKKEKVLDV